MLGRLMEDPEYLEQYHQLFDAFISAYFESGRVNDEITRVFNMIAPYVQKDPSAFCTFEEFEQGVSTLREYCERRAESVRKQLKGEIPSTEEGQSRTRASLWTRLIFQSAIWEVWDMGANGPRPKGRAAGTDSRRNRGRNACRARIFAGPTRRTLMRKDRTERRRLYQTRRRRKRKENGEMSGRRRGPGNRRKYSTVGASAGPREWEAFRAGQEQQSGKNQYETWIELGLRRLF